MYVELYMLSYRAITFVATLTNVELDITLVIATTLTSL